MLVLLSLAAAMTPAEQVEDFEVFWQAAEQHPALTLYTSREALEAAKAELRAQLDVERDAFRFWGLLAQTVSLIGCGHTGLEPNKAMYRSLPSDTAPFPLDLVVVDDTLHLDPRSTPQGGRLVAVEDTPADLLLAQLRGMIDSDARTTPFPDYLIDRYGYLYMTAVVGPRTAYKVTVERDGVEEDLTVTWPDSIRGQAEEPAAKRTIERIPVDDGFVVRASFDAFESQRAMRRKITRPVLRAIDHGAKGVILDLRRNGGGNWPAAADFVAHWQTEPWPTYSRRLISPQVAEERGWRDGWQRTDDGLVDMGYGDLGTWAPGEPHVDVPLVVLTSGHTFSTAADVAAFVRRDGLGTLVGTPTGGSGRIQTSQASKHGVLPNSGLHYSVALIRSDLADPDGALGPGDVVVPDVWVARSIDEIRTGADPALEAALTVIRDGPPVEPPLDAFVAETLEEVQVVDDLDAGLLASGTGWLRRGEHCLPVERQDDELVVSLCAVQQGEVAVQCDETRSVGRTWGDPMWECTFERPDGSGGGWGGAVGGSQHELPVLVEHTAERAVWREVVRVHASPERHRLERRPCTAASIDANGGQPTRSCDTSTGRVVVAASSSGAHGIGVTVDERDDPVDCATPCPPNPDMDAVRALNARYAGRFFAAQGGARATVHATREACEADDAVTFSGEGPEACAPEPAPWDAP